MTISIYGEVWLASGRVRGARLGREVRLQRRFRAASPVLRGREDTAIYLLQNMRNARPRANAHRLMAGATSTAAS